MPVPDAAVDSLAFPESIHHQYEQWLAAVSTDGMPEVQLQEMRRAFFSGVAAMYFSILALGGEGVGDDAAERWLESVGGEVAGFFLAVERGQG